MVEDKLPKELFNVLTAIVLRKHLGVIKARPPKNCVYAFTSKSQVRKVFCDLTDESLDNASFLKQKVKENKRVEAIINRDYQFRMKYLYNKEIVTIDFYYGYWNEHGWPQHALNEH